jgi:predicted nucleic-acid-binding Zn-ribbon protein
MSNKIFKKNSEGDCPVCGAEGNLDYDGTSIQEGYLFYGWTCKNCGATGEEFYSLVFEEHDNVYDKEGNEYIASPKKDETKSEQKTIVAT